MWILRLYFYSENPRPGHDQVSVGDGVEMGYIHSKEQIYTHFRGNESVDPRENESVILWGNESVDLRGNYSLDLRENESVNLRGNESVDLRGNYSVDLRENESVNRRGNESFYLPGNESGDLREKSNSISSRKRISRFSKNQWILKKMNQLM